MVFNLFCFTLWAPSFLASRPSTALSIYLKDAHSYRHSPWCRMFISFWGQLFASFSGLSNVLSDQLFTCQRKSNLTWKLQSLGVGNGCFVWSQSTKGYLEMWACDDQSWGSKTRPYFHRKSSADAASDAWWWSLYSIFHFTCIAKLILTTAACLVVLGKHAMKQFILCTLQIEKKNKEPFCPRDNGNVLKQPLGPIAELSCWKSHLQMLPISRSPYSNSEAHFARGNCVPEYAIKLKSSQRKKDRDQVVGSLHLIGFLNCKQTAYSVPWNKILWQEKLLWCSSRLRSLNFLSCRSILWFCTMIQSFFSCPNPSSRQNTYSSGFGSDF